LLEREDEPFHLRNAAVLMDGAEPQADVAPPTPAFAVFDLRIVQLRKDRMAFDVG
jgi:hypothetical protein